MAVDLALVADVLPDSASVAKDLGVMNIAGAIPFPSDRLSLPWSSRPTEAATPFCPRSRAPARWPAPVPSCASGRCPEVAVLGTKLHVPATRRPLVARPRLTELVRSGASELPRLVLVSAPAGFGKTTLLSQWLSPTRPGGQAPRVAWLSLDEGDNDLLGSWPISSERWRPAGWRSAPRRRHGSRARMSCPPRRS